jgi:hypothetical protein
MKDVMKRTMTRKPIMLNSNGDKEHIIASRNIVSSGYGQVKPFSTKNSNTNLTTQKDSFD